MRCGNCGRELPGNVSFCPGCGTPVAPANYSAPAPGVSFGDAPRAPLSGVGQPRKKSGCVKALIVLLVIGVLVLVGLGIAGYFGYRYAEDKLKSSEAYTVAVDALKSDPEVAAKMGEIKETGFPVGSFSENAGGTGMAAYHMSVTGTKASGQFDVAMTRRAGKWYMGMGRVTLANGERIELHPTLGEGVPLAPPADEPPAPPGGSRGKKEEAGVVNVGALDGKAVSKPAPPYPPAAKAARASGVVTVEVAVDERGGVTSAHATAGHTLLRAAAEAAARQARFSPTLVAGRPAKVRGTITYNFLLQ
jgi:TonB family protein